MLKRGRPWAKVAVMWVLCAISRGSAGHLGAHMGHPTWPVGAKRLPREVASKLSLERQISVWWGMGFHLRNVCLGLLGARPLLRLEREGGQKLDAGWGDRRATDSPNLVRRGRAGAGVRLRDFKPLHFSAGRSGVSYFPSCTSVFSSGRSKQAELSVAVKDLGSGS